MFQIVWLNLKINMKYNLLSVLLLSAIFYMLCIFGNEYIENYHLKSYMNTLDDSLYLIRSQDISRFDPKMEIGIIQESIPNNDETSESNACWYVNEFYSKNFIRNIRGSALNYQNGKREVLLYGKKFEKEYRIGDVIFLEGVSYQVVGFIPSYQPLFNLKFYGSVQLSGQSDQEYLMEAREMVEHYLTGPLNGNMYLVNDNSCQKGEQTGMVGGVIHFTIEKNYSDIDMVSMRNLKQILLDQIQYNSNFHMYGIILLFSVTVFIMVSMSFIQYKNCSQYMGVYALCGMSPRKYQFLSIMAWLVILSVAYFLDLMIYFVSGYGGDENAFFSPIKFIGLLAGVSMIGVYILNFALQKKAILDVLKVDS